MTVTDSDTAVRVLELGAEYVARYDTHARTGTLHREGDEVADFTVLSAGEVVFESSVELPPTLMERVAAWIDGRTEGLGGRCEYAVACADTATHWRPDSILGPLPVCEAHTAENFPKR